MNTNKLNPMKTDLSTLSDSEFEAEMKRRKLAKAAANESLKKNKKAYKELANEFVTNNIDGLVKHKNVTEQIINSLFKEYKTIQELKQEVYGTKAQDSHTSTLPDGSASITIGYNVTIGFDGTEDAGVEIIKTFISSLAGNDDNTKKLTKMVNTFLKPNAKTGMLNPSKIIELNKLRDEFSDTQFDKGLDIIMEAQERHQNSMYVSGWQYVTIEDGKRKKLEFRFTV